MRIKLLSECRGAIGIIRSWFYTNYGIVIRDDDAVICTLHTLDSTPLPDKPSAEWSKYMFYKDIDYFWVYIKKENRDRWDTLCGRLSELGPDISLLVSSALMYRAATLPHNKGTIAPAAIKAFGKPSIYTKRNSPLNSGLWNMMNWDAASRFFRNADKDRLVSGFVTVEDWRSPLPGE